MSEVFFAASPPQVVVAALNDYKWGSGSVPGFEDETQPTPMRERMFMIFNVNGLGCRSRSFSSWAVGRATG